MAYSFEKRLLVGKIETTEGVDVTPTVAANALITVGLDVSNLEAEKKTRNTDGQYFGARPSINAQVRKPFSFGVEIAGSGVSATTVPAWMPFNRVCGFDAGVAGGSSVVQTPISANIPSMSMYGWLDSLKNVALGARGNLSMVFEDDEIPMFNYEMMGFPPAAILTDSAPTSPTFAQADPILCSTANTTFLFDSYAFPLRRLTINMNNAIEPRSLIGPADRAFYRNRAVTWEAVCEMPTLGTKNPFTKFLSRATSVMQIVHGTVAGNIVQVDGARAETDEPAFSEEQGVTMVTLKGNLLPSSAAGNDELTITSK